MGFVPGWVILMHANCGLCNTLDRAKAFRLLGEPFVIPVGHATKWLADDLDGAISSLGPGEGLTLDFRGEVNDAPQIVVRRDEAGAVSLDDGEAWRWTSTGSPDSVTAAWHAVLTYLIARRDARGVILVPPTPTAG